LREFVVEMGRLRLVVVNLVKNLRKLGEIRVVMKGRVRGRKSVKVERENRRKIDEEMRRKKENRLV